VSQQGESQRRLYRDLLRNYNRLERPVVNDSQPLVVELQLSLLQIIDVDEKNQVLITNAWLQMYWVDVYLSWDQYEYPGVQNLRFPADQIWVPDILLYNSADERFDATFHTNVLVNYSGSCQYIPPGILKSTCYIDVRWFPFDVQKCDLKFGSWTHSGSLLDLQMLEADISNYISNGEWDLVAVPGKRNELYYECCKEPYPDVTYTVTMRRRTLYYGLNLLIPCVLISALALLVFLLPADSGEKISLGITVLLSLTVFMLLVAEIMPATSDSVPLIAQYFASIMVIVGLSVVVTVLVLQFHHHDPQAGKMPRWVSSFGGKYSSTDFQAKNKSLFLTPSQERDPRSFSAELLSSRSPQPVLVWVVIPPSGQDSVVEPHEVPLQPVEAPLDSNAALGYRSVLHWCLCPSHCHLDDGLPVVLRILEEVQFIAARFRRQDEGEEICSEWKFAAAVIDRLCLVAFTLFAIVCTLTILMSAPNFIEAVSKDFA
ncbi:ACHA7 protein, partial [Eudromia elegans]|nr:ACHA7 protein [Eudromia elegans]